jgi:hypothetical protein
MKPNENKRCTHNKCVKALNLKEGLTSILSKIGYKGLRYICFLYGSLSLCAFVYPVTIIVYSCSKVTGNTFYLDYK